MWSSGWQSLGSGTASQVLLSDTILPGALLVLLGAILVLLGAIQVLY